MAQKVYLVTGTSTGLGAIYLQEILDRGEIAVATARKPEIIQDRFNNATDQNFLALQLDVTKLSEIDSAFQAAVDKFSRIDVVVNNAGFGLAGPFEELDRTELRKMFHVNYWGLLDVTRKALETMRTQKPPGGLIQQVTSIGGQIGIPVLSRYCATKWAIEGFTETLITELKPEWGIKLMIVKPGGSRTNWSGASMGFPTERHPAYDHLDTRQTMGDIRATHPGDPVKMARAMYAMVNHTDPPLRAILGLDSVKLIDEKIAAQDKIYHREDLRAMVLSVRVDE